MDKTFSERQGFRQLPTPITVQNDAPGALREALPQIALRLNFGPRRQREVICEVLLQRPDPGNWSEYPNIEHEVFDLLDKCAWWKVYDIAEQLFKAIRESEGSQAADSFVDTLNEVFYTNGVGWEMSESGLIQLRSDAHSAEVVSRAHSNLASRRLTNSERELRMAEECLARRPEADVTGVVQHSIAALEGMVKQKTGSTETLGQAVKLLKDVPAPLRDIVSKLYGYSSSDEGGGRHGSERLRVDRSEAQLVFHLAAAFISYLS